jgi:annexin A7/11
MNTSPDIDAKTLRDAMKGIGTDEDAITLLVANRTNLQRQNIQAAYNKLFVRDLIKDLKSELSGNYEDAILALFDTPANYDSKQLRKAMKGMGTDESSLIEIISTRTSNQLNQVKLAYKTLYGKDLEIDIASETSGYFKTLLLALLNNVRSDNRFPNEDQCKVESELLYEAGEGTWGTDESVFIKIFTQRSPFELACIEKHYHQKTGKFLNKVIENEFSGDVKRLLLTIIHAMINPPNYFATLVNKAVKGWGTNDNLLIRVLVTRDEIDMPEIKKEYQKLYGKDMLQDIKDDTSGDYKKLLVELAGH